MDHLTRKCIAVKEAEARAKDPEFKKLWHNVLTQLLEKYANAEGKKIYEDTH